MIYLSALAALVAVAAFNRLSQAAWLNKPVLDVLRPCDLIVVFLLAPVAIFLLWGLFKVLRGDTFLPATLLFLLGAFLTGVAFGMHEPMNVLSSVHRASIPPQLLNSIIFLDDGLGHYVFFAGFMSLSLAGIWAELRDAQSTEPFSRNVLVCAAVTGIVTAAVIYANMVHEKALIDIAILAITVAISAVLQLVYGSPSFRKLPLLIALCLGYGGGVLATLLYWLIRGMP